MRTRTWASGLMALALGAMAVTGCSDNASKESSTASDETPTVRAGQPDVNGDGKVKIGVISPGDTNDGGYYEDFVRAARDYTKEVGWELVILDQVNPADGPNQARNLCRQKVDMVALAAVELKDALSAADDPLCADSVFSIYGDATGLLSPKAAQANAQATATQWLTGYAAGLVLKAQGAASAGYVGGPELDFARAAVEAFTLGLRTVLPDAKLVTTYTGSFDDSGKAREAVTAQAGQGATIVYPYLGGATDAGASAAKEGGALAIAPGTDRCDDPAGRFGISSLFATGGFFTNSLKEFAEGKLEVGKLRIYEIGVDEWPNVKVCGTVEGADAIQAEVDAMAKKIAAGEQKVD